VTRGDAGDGSLGAWVIPAVEAKNQNVDHFFACLLAVTTGTTPASG
jgi:hypothetical protein